MEIKGFIAAAGHHLGLLHAYAFLRRKLTRSQVAILMYHRVCAKKDDWSLKPVSPQTFERQMEYFCRNYEILSLEKLVQYIQQGKSLPEKAVAITFDDGYEDNYLYAYPILNKYHMPATIFLTTGYIGSGNLFWTYKVRYAIWNTRSGTLDLDELGSHSLMSVVDRQRTTFIILKALKKLSEGKKNLLIEKLLSTSGIDITSDLGKELFLAWDEIKEMSNNGIAFGAHSVNHLVLTNLPLRQAKWEITQSKKDIEEKIGTQVTAFSYPNGDFNAELVEFIRESGFTCAVSAGTPRLISSMDNPYTLSRIGLGEDFHKSKVIISGLWGDLQGILRQGRG